jgi:hypothetical protein
VQFIPTAERLAAGNGMGCDDQNPTWCLTHESRPHCTRSQVVVVTCDVITVVGLFWTTLLEARDDERKAANQIWSHSIIWQQKLEAQLNSEDGPSPF